MKINFIMLFGFAYLLIGCDFPLEQENFVTLSTTPKTEVIIDIANTGDTLLVFKDIQLTYAIDVGGAPQYIVLAVFENGSQIFNLGRANTGSFLIKSTMYGTGYIPFELAVLSTTGTGSIADKYFRELLLFSYPKVLRFDNTPPAKINFTSVNEINGSVHLAWPAYPHDNLVSLKLRSIWKPTPGSSELVREIVLPLNTTDYTDTDFIGGEVRYSLVTTNNWNKSATGEEFKLQESSPDITEFEPILDKVLIKWKRPKYLNNIKGYEISLTGKPPFITLTNPSDTSALIEGLPFGTTTKLIFKTLSKNISMSVSTEKNVWVGIKRTGVKRMFDDPINNQVFYLNAPYFVKEHNNKMDTLELSFTDYSAAYLEKDGQTMYLTADERMYEIRTSDLKLVKTYQLPGLLMHGLYVRDEYVYIIHKWLGSVTRYSIFNKATKTIISSDGNPNSDTMYSWVLHPDNTNILQVGNGIFVMKFNSDHTLSLQSDSDYVRGKTAFPAFGSDPDEVVIIQRTSAMTWGRYTFPGLIPIGVPITLPYQSLSEDLEHKQVAVWSNPSSLKVMDIETMTIKKSLYSGASPPVILSGDRIIVNGYMLLLK